MQRVICRRGWANVAAAAGREQNLTVDGFYYYYYYYYKCHGLECCQSHSCGGTNLDLKLLHSSMHTSADYRSRRRHVSRMTDEKGETWSPSGMSKVSGCNECSFDVGQVGDVDT